MIRYDFDLAQIEAAVDALNPQWRTNAAARTEALVAKGRYEETSSIWSEVKEVFIHLQNRKCVFCERQFESPEFGRIEYDVEHFRPKSGVRSWPPPDWPTTHDGPMGQPSPRGYFWLAYNLQNYAATCKVCNSPLKSDFFPIAGGRVTTRRTIDQMASEKPYLCYPIGRVDDVPEKLVTFIATTAVPAARSGNRRRRGEVIIDFFQLNGREQLHRERARMIMLLGFALKSIADEIDVADNERLATGLLQPNMPHTACLRAFRRTWDSDNPLARRIHSVCRDYAISVEGTQPPVV
jgi:hypothetical protein